MKTSFLVLALGLASVVGASARDFGRTTTVVSGRGVATRQVSGYVVPCAASRITSTTGPHGQTATASRQVTGTAGNRSTSGLYTGPQGQTVSTQGGVTYSNGTRTATRSATGPQGQTKSVTKTTTRP